MNYIKILKKSDGKIKKEAEKGLTFGGLDFGRFNLPKLGDIERLTKSCIKRVGVMGFVFLIVLGMSFTPSQINDIPAALAASHSFSQINWAAGANTSAVAVHGSPNPGQPATDITSFYATSSPYITTGVNVSLATTTPGSFAQTDWIDGESITTANNTSNQTGWTLASTTDNQIATSTAGQLTLKTSTGNKQQTDNGTTETGFNLAGSANSNTAVVATGGGAVNLSGSGFQSASQDINYNALGDYTYDNAKIEFTGTAARLKNQSAGPSEITPDATDTKGLWHLNEGNGTSASDSSVSGNTGTLGSNSLVSGDNFDDNSFDTAKWAWTTSAQTLTNTESGGTLNLSTATNPVAAYNVTKAVTPTVLTGDFDIQVDFSNLSTTGGVPGAGTPTHIFARLLVQDASNNAFYAQIMETADTTKTVTLSGTNGTVSGSALTTTNTSGKLRIQRIGTTITGYFWNGTAWVTLQAYTSTTLNTALIALAQHNQNTGFTINASFDNFKNTNAPDWITAGKFSNALSFDGVDDYVKIPNSASLNINGAGSKVTMEAWIKQDALLVWPGKIIMKKGNSDTTDVMAERQYLMYVYGSDVRINSVASGATAETSVGTDNATNPTGIVAGQWYHVAGVIDSAACTMKIYVNGVEKASGPYNTTYCANGIRSAVGSLFIGTNDNLYYFNGSIDEVAIWNTALSAATIASHAGIDYAPASEATVMNITALSLANISSYTSFTETATKPANTSIDYQLSNDNGATWCNYAAGAWSSPCTAGNASYTPASDLTGTAMAAFPIGNDTLKIKARLNTTDGSARPELGNINIGYNIPSGYSTSGTYTSGVLDTGQKSDFTTASWTATTTGADTFTHTSDGEFNGTNSSTIVSSNSVGLSIPDPTTSPSKLGYCNSGSTDSRCSLTTGSSYSINGGTINATTFFIESGVTVSVNTGQPALVINTNGNVDINGILQANGGDGATNVFGAAGAGGNAGGGSNAVGSPGTSGGGDGTGNSTGADGGGGGGGYGGLGGTGGGFFGLSSSSYGLAYGAKGDTNGGAGGGGGSSTNYPNLAGGGGGGGGRILISTNQIISIGTNGLITVNGGIGGNGASYYNASTDRSYYGGGGGGGSGGNITLKGFRIINNGTNGSGSIQMKGNNGGNNGGSNTGRGGGGGGGRLLLSDFDGVIEGSGTTNRLNGITGNGGSYPGNPGVANSEAYTENIATGYGLSGTYTSSIKEVGMGEKFKSIAWTEALPGGANATTMKVRTCNDDQCSGEAAFSTLLNITNGQDYSASPPTGVTNGDGWVQYEASLSTANTAVTPTLDSVTITTIPLVLEMRAGTDNTPDDGGWTGWFEIGSGATPASPVSLGTTFDGNQYIQYRAKFSTVDTAYSPSLDDITLNYQYYPVNANYSLVSSSFNTEDAANTISSISWNGSTTTAASIKFQIRATSTEALLPGTNWCGPTVCDGTEYFTDSYNGSTITNTALTAGSGAQWFQYKAVLSTAESNQTPILNDVTVNYKRKLYGGNYELISSPYDTGDPANVIGSLTMNVGALPSGTTAKIQIRTASIQGGLTSAIWCATDCSGNTYFIASATGINSFSSLHTSLQDSSGDQWWQYKIILTPSADSLDAPMINSVDVVYVINTAPTVNVNSAIIGSDGKITVNYDLTDAENDSYEAYLFYDIGVTLTSDNTTTLTLSDTSKLPTAPNYIQIGTEVIKYGAIVNGTTLGTLTRGTADGSWPGGLTRHTRSYSSGSEVWIMASASAITASAGNYGTNVSKSSGKTFVWQQRAEQNLQSALYTTAKLKVLVHDGNVANQLSSQNGSSTNSGNVTLGNRMPQFNTASFSEADPSSVLSVTTSSGVALRQCNVHDTDAGCSAGKVKLTIVTRDPDAGDSARSPQGKLNLTYALSTDSGATFSTSTISVLTTTYASTTIETVNANYTGNYNPAYATSTVYFDPGISSGNLIVRVAVSDNEFTVADPSAGTPTPGSPAVYATSNTINYDATIPSGGGVVFDAGVAGTVGVNNITITHPTDTNAFQYIFSATSTDGTASTTPWTNLSGAGPSYLNWGFDTATTSKSVNIKFRDAYGNTQTSTTTASNLAWPLDAAAFLVQDVSKTEQNDWRLYIGWQTSTSSDFASYKLEYATSTDNSTFGSYSEIIAVTSLPKETNYYVHTGLNNSYYYRYRVGVKDTSNNITVRSNAYINAKPDGIQNLGEGGGGTAAAAAVVTNVVPTQNSNGTVSVSYKLTDILSSKTSPSYEAYVLYDLGITLTASSTASLDLSDTSKLPSSGYIQINQEVIKYTGKSGNSLTGITRAVWPTTGTSRATRQNTTMLAGLPVWVVASSSQTPITNNTISSGQSGTIVWTTSNDANISSLYLSNVGIRVLVHDNQGASSGPLSSQSDQSDDGVIAILDLKSAVIGSDSLKINSSSSSIEAPPANTVSLSLQNITTDTASETLYIQFASSTPVAVWRGAKNDGTLDMTENSWGEATSTASLSTASWVWPISGRSESITVRIKDAFGNVSTTTDDNSIIRNAPAEFTTSSLTDTDASSYESKSNTGIVIRQCNIYDTDSNCSQGKVKVKLQVRDPDASDSLLATKGTVHTDFLISIAGGVYSTTTAPQLSTTYSSSTAGFLSSANTQDLNYGTSTVSQLGANSTATGGVSDVVAYDPQYTEVVAYISSIGQSGSLKVKAVVTDNEVGTTPQSAESNTIQYDITAPPATTMTFDAGIAGTASSATVTIPVPADGTTTQYMISDYDASGVSTNSSPVSSSWTTLTTTASPSWSFDSDIEAKALYYRYRDIYGNAQSSTSTATALAPPLGSSTRVEDVSTTLPSQRIFLGWEKSTASEFSLYRIEYASSTSATSATDDTGYSAYTELVTLSDINTNYFIHSELNSSAWYRYRLSTKNTGSTGGNYSVKSIKNSNAYVVAKPDGTANGDESTANDVSAPTASGATATSTDASASKITWSTNELSDSAVTYSTDADAVSGLSSLSNLPVGISLTRDITFVTSTSTDPDNSSNNNYYTHSIQLSELTPGTTYYFRVWSQDASSNLGSSSSSSFTTTGGPAIQASTIRCNSGVCSDLDAYKITSSAVTITWSTTADASTSYIEYKPTQDITATSSASQWVVAGNDTATNSHSVALSNLSNGVYEFYVRSKNSSNLTSRYPSGYPETSSLKFKVDVAAPVILGTDDPEDVNAPMCTATESSLTLTWLTDQKTTTEVYWGANLTFTGQDTSQTPSLTDLNSSLTLNSMASCGPVVNASYAQCNDTHYNIWRKNADKSRTHSYTISGLTEDTGYTVVLRSSNGSSSSNNSDNYTFSSCSTLAKEVVTETVIIRQQEAAKDLTAPAISALSAFNITANSAMIDWKTDENADSLVEYGLSSIYGKIVGALTDFITDHRVGLAGLEPQTTYHFRVTSVDGSGNRAFSSDQTFTTLSLEEQSKISEKELKDIKEELEKAKEKAEEVKEALTPEELKEREEILEKAIKNVNEILSTLTQDVSLEVLEENLISTKETIDAIAKSIPAPVIIGGVPDVKVEGVTATISWKTNKEANSIIGYAKEDAYDPNKTEPYSTEAGQSEEEAKEHKVVLTNLSPASLYHFQIRSKSKLGPIGRSRDFIFQTSMETPEILEYSFKEITESSFTVSWTTNVPMTSLVEYTPFKNGVLQTDLSGTQGRPEFSPLHEIKVANILADTQFNVAISGLDIVGNKIAKSIGTIRTIKDVKAPQISKTRSESTLFPGKDEKAQTVIFWETDEPATSQIFWKEGVGKGELLSSTKLDQELTTQHVVVINDFKPGTVYRFQVESKDPTGNKSRSTDYTVLTPKKGQTVIDLIITNFQDIFGFLGKLQ